MGVGRTDLLRTVRLSRLRFSEPELERLTAELDAILQHVEQLLAIAVDVGAPAPFGSTPAAPLRADEPAADPLEQPLALTAPDWRAGYFTVPRVLPP